MDGSAIGTGFVMRNMVQNFLNLQSEYVEKNLEITSEKKTQNYAKLAEAGQASNLMELQSKVGELSDYGVNNFLVINKLNTMDKAFGNLNDAANKAKRLMTLETFFVDPTDNFKAILGFIRDNLNASYGNESLFSGGITNRLPVGDIINISNVIGGEISANYYQGDELTGSIQASDSLKINYGIKANDEAFQNLIGSIHMAMTAYQQNDTELKHAASDLIDKAMGSLVKLRAMVEDNLTNLRDINSSNEKIVLYYNQRIEGLTKTDIIQATIEVGSIDATLKASAKAINQLSHLSLMNYLD